MKQLIIIILLVAGGYYLYNNGFVKIFNDMRLNPKEFVSDVKNAAAASSVTGAKTLPAKTPERSCEVSISKSSLNSLESLVFSSYDSKAAFALVEFAYAAGLPEAETLINRYLSVFTLSEEKMRILNLVSKHHDKQSLEMLNKFFLKGTFSRKTVLRKMADFKTTEAAEIIIMALEDQNAAVRAEAEAIYNEVQNEPWFSAAVNKKKTLAGKHTADIINIPLGQ